MRSLKNLGLCITGGACMLAIVVLSANSALARPKYAAVISAQYPELTEKHGKDGKLGCAVCHPVKDKKKRNNYGVELSKHIGKKNQTDEDKIKEALTKSEEGKSHVEGKTFGDLIKAGILPGDDKEAE